MKIFGYFDTYGIIGKTGEKNPTRPLLITSEI